MVLNVIPFVHKLLSESITKEDICIDATAGNGHDTLFLSKHSKHVIAFDVQKEALRATETLLKENNVTNYTLILDGHENLQNHVTEKVRAVTFNLGYLPGSDKTIQTNESSTIEAIEQSLDILVQGGVITIILYIGHDGGLKEAKSVETYVSSLDKKNYRVIKYDFINREKSPYVLVIEKQ